MDTPELVQAATPAASPMKDGEFARLMFKHLPGHSQLKWALMLKRMKQQTQYRGVLPRGTGRRAQARSQGFSTHWDYAYHMHQKELEAQRKAELEAAKAGAYEARPVAQAVHQALN